MIAGVGFFGTYLAAFLAADDDPAGVDDDAEVFVEIKTAGFLAALDLPVPADLSG